MIERPTFVQEQVGKLGNAFRSLSRASMDGQDTSVIAYQMSHGIVIVDPEFINGMVRVVEGIRGDLRQEDQEHLFYTTLKRSRSR